MNIGLLFLNKGNKVNYEIFNTFKTLKNNNKVNSIYILNISGKRIVKKDRLGIYLKKGLVWIISSIIINLISEIENLILSKIDKRVSQTNEKKELDICDDKKGRIKIIDINIEINKKGYYAELDQKSINILANLQLDFILNFGGPIWRGDILNISKIGIISIHHANNIVNRGGPPGFWEVFNKEDFSGFTIQTLTKTLDGGKVISRGFVKTQRFWISNFSAIRIAALREWLRVIDRLINFQEINYKNEIKIYQYELFKNPNLLQTFFYLYGRILFLLNKFKNKFILRKAMRWQTAFLQTNDWRELQLRKAKYLPNSEGRYYADPNLFTFEKESYLLVENFDIKNQIGNIKCFKLGDNPIETKDLGVVLKEDVHLSFPYTFEYEKKLYLTLDSDEKYLRIYSLNSKSLKWELLNKCSFEGIDNPNDPIIFEKNSLWWLIFTDEFKNNEMFIFYSNSPLDNNWIPHKLNPVLINQKYSRNGGFIKHNDYSYRVAQSPGFNNYGKSISLMLIEELTPNTYSEKNVENIYPYYDKKIKGIHTISKNSEFTVFDFWKLIR